MSAEELWSLHEQVAAILARKISAKKARLEQRLRQLGHGVLMNDEQVSDTRPPYPKVVPKFRNPTRPSETWAGRGKQPRWLAAQLRSGKKLDDFRIKSAAQTRRHTH
jgi:DNA-binding protein H-NS